MTKRSELIKEYYKIEEPVKIREKFEKELSD